MVFQPTQMCMKRYDRAARLHGHYTMLYCTNPALMNRGWECEGPHSWQAIYDNDSQMLDAVVDHLAERERERVGNPAVIGVAQNDAEAGELVEVKLTGGCDDIDPAVQDFCDAIVTGEYDDYLEMILDAGHSRKKERRGVVGFRRRDRRRR